MCEGGDDAYTYWKDSEAHECIQYILFAVQSHCQKHLQSYDDFLSKKLGSIAFISRGIYIHSHDVSLCHNYNL